MSLGRGWECLGRVRVCMGRVWVRLGRVWVCLGHVWVRRSHGVTSKLIALELSSLINDDGRIVSVCVCTSIN